MYNLIKNHFVAQHTVNSWLLLHWLSMHDHNKIFNTAVGIFFVYCCIFGEHLAVLSLCLTVAVSVFLVHSSVCNMKTLNTLPFLCFLQNGWKWKKVVLSIKQNLELIKKVERRESAANLVREYSIGVQTAVDINWNKRKWEECAGDIVVLVLPN